MEYALDNLKKSLSLKNLLKKLSSIILRGKRR
jgi:hypothetical protein